MKPLVILVIWSQVQAEHDQCWWTVAEHRINISLYFFFFLKYYKTGTFCHLSFPRLCPIVRSIFCLVTRISALCLQNTVRHHQKDTQFLKIYFDVYSLELPSEEDTRIINVVFWVLELKWNLKGLLGGAWCYFDITKTGNPKPTFNFQKMETIFQIEFLP